MENNNFMNVCRRMSMYGYVGIWKYEYEEEDEKRTENGNVNADENVD